MNNVWLFIYLYYKVLQKFLLTKVLVMCYVIYIKRWIESTANRWNPRSLESSWLSHLGNVCVGSIRWKGNPDGVFVEIMCQCLSKVPVQPTTLETPSCAWGRHKREPLGTQPCQLYPIRSAWTGSALQMPGRSMHSCSLSPCGLMRPLRV